MATLNPYLFFPGTCREAMTFYKDILGGKLDIMTVGDSPMGAQMSADEKGKIMHSYLETEGIVIMGSDNINGMEVKSGNTVTLCLVCKSKEEIESLFSKLSAGGKVNMPLKQEFFGWFGAFTDKFGIEWMMQQGGEQPK